MGHNINDFRIKTAFLSIGVEIVHFFLLVCDSVLGMESGLISDLQISASSRWDSNHAPTQARLNYQETKSKSGAWAAAHNNDKQWLQISLGNTKITRVATQGRNYSPSWPYGSHSQWVTKYKLQYSDDGVTFQYYKEQGIVKVIIKNISYMLL